MAARAYLDWAAGAPLHPAARDAVSRVLALGVGNPSSVHAEGRAAQELLEEARAQVAGLVGCDPAEVIFTASGSEANAAAILGGLSGGRLVVGSIEHASVRLAAAVARRSGLPADDLPCRPDGRYDLEAAARILVPSGASAPPAAHTGLDHVQRTRGSSGPGAARDEGGAGSGKRSGSATGAPVGLLVVQLANNETGALQPVEELAALARDARMDVHVDAVQAAGKVDLAAVWARSRSLSLSAHKLGGIAGAGALCLRRGSELAPRIPGHQERGLRGGTHGLAAIAAFGAVAAAAVQERESRMRRLSILGSRLESIVRSTDGRTIVNATSTERIPGIVSATFPGADGETLLVALDLAGVAAAHGAACSTGAMEPSHVLLAMGLDAGVARSTIRFSVGPGTGDDELDRLEKVLPGALQAARLG